MSRSDMAPERGSLATDLPEDTHAVQAIVIALRGELLFAQEANERLSVSEDSLHTQLELARRHNHNLELCITDIQRSHAELQHDLAFTRDSHAQLNSDYEQVCRRYEDLQGKLCQTQRENAELKVRITTMETARQDQDFEHWLNAGSGTEAERGRQEQHFEDVDMADDPDHPEYDQYVRQVAADLCHSYNFRARIPNALTIEEETLFGDNDDETGTYELPKDITYAESEDKDTDSSDRHRMQRTLNSGNGSSRLQSESQQDSQGSTPPSSTTSTAVKEEDTTADQTELTNIAQKSHTEYHSLEEGGAHDELPEQAEQQPSGTASRYRPPRRTGPRFARGTLPTGPVGFKFLRKPKSLQGVWDQWFNGTDGNAPIQSLESTHGVGWRNCRERDEQFGGTELGYASNYVSIRRKVVEGIQKWAGEYNVAPGEICRRWDAVVKGRVHEDLLPVLKRGEDPLLALKH